MTKRFTVVLYKLCFAFFLMTIVYSCKKDISLSVNLKIEKLVLINQVHNWYDSSLKSLNKTSVVKTGFGINSQRNIFSIGIDSLKWEKAYINFDSSNLKGVAIPISTDSLTGEYFQLSTLNINSKTKGYIVRTTPDSSWFRKNKFFTKYRNLDGKISIYDISGKLISSVSLKNGIVLNEKNNTNSSLNGNQLVTFCDGCTLDEVTVIGYISSYIQSINLGFLSYYIIDSGPDLSFTDPIPLDPYYFNIGGMGGTPTDYTIYDCACNCTENDDLEFYLDNFEPKWGQLGNLNTILLELKKNELNTYNFTGKTLTDKFESIKNYFEANRMFTRDINNNLVDAQISKKVDRYIYTFEKGWIDMHHFFYAAYLSEKNNTYYATSVTTSGEFLQWLKGNNSAFSYEDIPSDIAGVDFYKEYKDKLKNGTITIDEAVFSYFISIYATEPTLAPNFDYIPHVIDEYYATNKSAKGLTGTVLHDAAVAAFCQKTTARKQSIKEAHQKIKYSSN